MEIIHSGLGEVQDQCPPSFLTSQRAYQRIGRSKSSCPGATLARHCPSQGVSSHIRLIVDRCCHTWSQFVILASSLIKFGPTFAELGAELHRSANALSVSGQSRPRIGRRRPACTQIVLESRFLEEVLNSFPYTCSVASRAEVVPMPNNYEFDLRMLGTSVGLSGSTQELDCRSHEHRPRANRSNESSARSGPGWAMTGARL